MNAQKTQENRELEESFREFTDNFLENRAMKVRYFTIHGYILFHLSPDGIFWTESFYFTQYIDTDLLIKQIDFYLEYGYLP